MLILNMASICCGAIPAHIQGGVFSWLLMYASVWQDIPAQCHILLQPSPAMINLRTDVVEVLDVPEPLAFVSELCSEKL